MIKRITTTVAAAAVALTCFGGAAMAQPYPGRHDGPPGYDRDHDHRGGPPGHAYGHDHRWRRGERMDRDSWRRGARVDWRHHHLRQPPRGYEWREVNGDYVLAAVTTGLIASIIAASH